MINYVCFRFSTFQIFYAPKLVRSYEHYFIEHLFPSTKLVRIYLQGNKYKQVANEISKVFVEYISKEFKGV